MVIPYIDRSREAQGIWFGTKYSVRLAVISTIYAVLVSAVLVVFDAGETNVFPSQVVPGEGPTFRAEQMTRWIPSCDNEAAHQGFPCLRDDEGANHQGFLTMKDVGKRLQFSLPIPEWFGAPTSDGKMDYPADLDHIPVPFNGAVCDLSYGTLHLWCDMHLNIGTIMAEQVIPLSTIVFFTVLIIYVLFRAGWVRTRRDVFIIMFTAVMTAYLTLSMVGSFFRGEGQALIGPWDVKVDEG